MEHTFSEKLRNKKIPFPPFYTTFIKTWIQKILKIIFDGINFRLREIFVPFRKERGFVRIHAHTLLWAIVASRY